MENFNSTDKIFIDFSKLNDEERLIIGKMVDNWTYGNQFVLQEQYKKLSKEEYIQ